MNYQKNIEKYKKRYLIEKNKMKGGANIVNLKILNEVPFFNKKEEIELLDSKPHMIVPMNAYQTVDNTNKNILTTTGITDCVAVMIYNPIYGRYFAHFLRNNEFMEEFSNACILLNVIDRPLVCEKKYEYECNEKNTCKISSSLPEWINEKNTVIHIISLASSLLILARYVQIISKALNSTIYLYLPTPQEPSKDIYPEGKYYDDAFRYYENSCKRNLYIINKLFNPSKEFLDKWSSFNSTIYYEIFGMLPNGEIFVTNRGILGEKTKVFYESKEIKTIKVPHLNDRCITQMSIIINQ
jgi:hypothetical protein